jgi:cysteine synthase A
MPDLPLLNREHIDGYLQVTDQEAIRMARRLAREEGIFAGFSSGANLAGAIQLLEGEFKGRTVGVMICDSGLKYLSTDLWEDF